MYRYSLLVEVVYPHGTVTELFYKDTNRFSKAFEAARAHYADLKHDVLTSTRRPLPEDRLQLA